MNRSFLSKYKQTNNSGIFLTQQPDTERQDKSVNHSNIFLTQQPDTERQDNNVNQSIFHNKTFVTEHENTQQDIMDTSPCKPQSSDEEKDDYYAIQGYDDGDIKQLIVKYVYRYCHPGTLNLYYLNATYDNIVKILNADNKHYNLDSIVERQIIHNIKSYIVGSDVEHNNTTTFTYEILDNAVKEKHNITFSAIYTAWKNNNDQSLHNMAKCIKMKGNVKIKQNKVKKQPKILLEEVQQSEIPPEKVQQSEIPPEKVKQPEGLFNSDIIEPPTDKEQPEETAKEEDIPDDEGGIPEESKIINNPKPIKSIKDIRNSLLKNTAYQNALEIIATLNNDIKKLQDNKENDEKAKKEIEDRIDEIIGKQALEKTKNYRSPYELASGFITEQNNKIKDLENENATLKNKIQSLTRHFEQAIAKYKLLNDSDKDKQILTLQNEMEKMKIRLQNLDRENQRLNLENQNLKFENQRLKSENQNQAQKIQQQANQIITLQSENQRLKSENQKLKLRITDLESKITILENQIHLKDDNIANLQRQLDGIVTLKQKITELEQTIVAQTALIAELQTQLQQKNPNAGQGNQQEAQLRQQLSQVQLQLAQLTNDYNKITQKKTQLEQEMRKSQQQNQYEKQALEQQLAQYKHNLQLAQDELLQQKQSNTQLQEKLDKALNYHTTLQNKIYTLNQEIEKLRKLKTPDQSQLIQQMQLEINNLKNQMKQREEVHQQEILQYQLQIQKYKQDLDDVIKKLNNLSQTGKEKDQEIQRLRKQIDTLNTNMLDPQERNKILNDTIIISQAENKQLTTEKDNEASKLQQTIAAQQKEIVQLRSNIAQIELNKQNIKSPQLQALQQENNQLKQDNSTQDKKITQLQQEYNKLSAQFITLTTNYKDIEDKYNLVADATEKNINLLELCNVQREEIAKLTQELTRVKHEFSELEKIAVVPVEKKRAMVVDKTITHQRIITPSVYEQQQQQQQYQQQQYQQQPLGNSPMQQSQYYQQQSQQQHVNFDDATRRLQTSMYDNLNKSPFHQQMNPTLQQHPNHSPYTQQQLNQSQNKNLIFSSVPQGQTKITQQVYQPLPNGKNNQQPPSQSPYTQQQPNQSQGGRIVGNTNATAAQHFLQQKTQQTGSKTSWKQY